MTIKELAQIAGVSTATVSRALNNNPGINAKTQKRILQLAEELGYEPNLMAKGLSSQRTYTIGVLISDVTNPFYSEILRGIEDIVTQYNYTTAIINTDYDVEKERRALSLLRNGRMDGLIAYVSNRVADECMTLVKMEYPIVMLGHLIEELKCPKIGCNNFSSAYAATEYLIKAGHRKIAHIAGHRETKTGIQRYQGYKAAMANYDYPVDPQWVIPTDYSGHSAYENTLKFLSKHPDITAIFAANDAIAAGCYRALHESGYRIPDDISVIGHDDTEVASILIPTLTTMQQEKRKIGRIAAQSMFRILSTGTLKEDVIIVPTKLIERKSVKKLSE